MPNILWASQMTPKIESKESSFILAFDTKFILSSKIVFLTPRIESFDKKTFKEGLQVKLNLISELKAESHL